jgi:hypothetical protein
MHCTTTTTPFFLFSPFSLSLSLSLSHDKKDQLQIKKRLPKTNKQANKGNAPYSFRFLDPTPIHIPFRFPPASAFCTPLFDT